MTIDFVSNFALGDHSGGWNGINHKLYNALKDVVEVNYVGPVNPPVVSSEKLFSKMMRVASLRGSYYFFSEQRLNNISRMIEERELSGDLTFFFGVTPWVKFRPGKPFAVYLDICFSRYLDIYLPGQKFRLRDISRIHELERKFLTAADYVFWGSRWAMEEAENLFQVRFPNSHVISTGGHIELPAQSSAIVKKNLLFISLNFLKKGGMIAFQAFKALRENYPELTLTIIGERPPQEVLSTRGVIYLGMLRKDDASHMKIFKDQLGGAFFLIHPTEMDTMGAVIAEAGYFGLPTIAPENFGIPDLIQQGATGIMVNKPLSVHKFVDPLKEMLDNEDKYLEMRRRVKEFMCTERSWTTIANKIVKIISH